MKMNIFGGREIFKVEAVFPFNSDRKRMSVLVRDEDGTLILYCKGADSVLEKLLNKNVSQELLNKTKDQVYEFSMIGLRTLFICKKIISNEIFKDWKERYVEASSLIENREEELEKLQDELENDFELIGATAVEDKLQTGVPETIDLLLKEGIKLWVITGDKIETAINIGLSCKLLKESTK